MSSFLGELMGLVVWLIQHSYRSIRTALGCPVDLNPWEISAVRIVGSCNSSWQTDAMVRYANGPPWDWWARLLGHPVWPKDLVAVPVPSRRSVRG